MAIVSNPNFSGGFDAAVFREAIKSTMQMGSPNSVQEKVTFMWKNNITYTGKVGIDGKPYDKGAVVVDNDKPDDIQVDCAVEYIDRTSVGSPLGEFNNPRVLITVLDVDFEQIKTADMVKIGGNTYNIQYSRPNGLFNVDIYEIFAQAVDES